MLKVSYLTWQSLTGQVKVAPVILVEREPDARRLLAADQCVPAHRDTRAIRSITAIAAAALTTLNAVITRCAVTETALIRALERALIMLSAR